MNAGDGKISFIEELKRRNVFRVAVAYLISAWLLLQLADIVLENISAPQWVMQVFMLALAVGLPIALIFAWAFELTPEGLKREKDVDRSQSITPQTGRKLDFMIIGVLAVVIVLLLVDRFTGAESEMGSEPFSQAELTEKGSEMGSDPISINSGQHAAAKNAEIGSDPISAGREQGSLLQPQADTTNVGGSIAADKKDEKSIAVLPFVNMSSDPEQEYFSDGISEEILNALAKVKDLKVAGRTSSFAFKGENQDLRQVGQTLGVEHILEGSVRKSGTKVRITAQLIQVDDGFHLWSESYDRELDDVFAIQDEIATAILEQLKAHLLDDQPVLVATERADTEAYELYLLAKQRMYERTGPTIQSAAELLDRAIAIDPNYAPAYAQRGIAELLMSEGAGSYGEIPRDQSQTQGKVYLDKAMQLDPELAEAWAGLGLYYNNEPVITDRGIEPLQKALALNPNLIDASNWLSISLISLGRPAEALEVTKNMVERDPLYRPGVRNMINGYLWFGEIEKAEALIERVRPLIPNDATIASSVSAVLMEKGELAKALRMTEQAIALQPSNSIARLTRGFAWMSTQQLERVATEGEEFQPVIALTLLGRKEEAGRLAQQRLTEFADVVTWVNYLLLTQQWEEAADYIEAGWPDLQAYEQAFPPYGAIGYWTMLDAAVVFSKSGRTEKYDDAMQRVSRVHAALIQQGADNALFLMSEASRLTLAGDYEGALELLEQAINRGFVTTSQRIVVEYPHLEALESDPRFEAIQARMIEHLNTERAELGLEPVST